MNNHLPDFLIIGAMKSGTTSLYDDLANHPNTWLPKRKEPDILHISDDHGEIDNHYRLHFTGAQPHHILGEASTMYTMKPWFADVSKVAYDVIGPELKIIYIMRDPIKRIYSHLAHDYSSGRITSTDFDRIVFEEDRYINVSDYALQITPWIKQFGLQNILCIAFEDYIKTREEVVAKVAAFIGLDPALIEYRQSISNPKGSARSFRIKFLKTLQKTSFYRYFLYRYMPKTFISMLQKCFTKQHAIPEIRLSAPTIARLESRFDKLSNQLEALGVGKFTWPHK